MLRTSYKVDIANSINGIPIRITGERWQHITTGHPEIADYYYEILETIENPDIIYEGANDAKIAIRKFQEAFTSKFVVAVYKESSPNDGFVITAYFSKKQQEFTKKKIVWKR